MREVLHVLPIVIPASLVMFGACLLGVRRGEQQPERDTSPAVDS